VKNSLTILLIAFTLLTFGNAHKWLKKIDAYNTSSYYKYQIYKQENLVSFLKLKEINRTIQIDSFDFMLMNACIFYCTNQLRNQHKMPLYLYDKRLQDAAMIHSWQMAKYHFFEHNNPYTSSLSSVEKRLNEMDVKYSMSGENCHLNLISEDEFTYLELAQKVIESLYHSTLHRQNLLSKTFKFCANGIALERKNEDVYLYVTQDFYK
jgi:hypothetical protein